MQLTYVILTVGLYHFPEVHVSSDDGHLGNGRAKVTRDGCQMKDRWSVAGKWRTRLSLLTPKTSPYFVIYRTLRQIKDMSSTAENWGIQFPPFNVRFIILLSEVQLSTKSHKMYDQIPMHVITDCFQYVIFHYKNTLLWTAIIPCLLIPSPKTRVKVEWGRVQGREGEALVRWESIKEGKEE